MLTRCKCCLNVMINTEKHYLCVENYQRIMKIALIGYGKMGKEIEKIALSRGHEIVSIIDIKNRSMSPASVR